MPKNRYEGPGAWDCDTGHCDGSQESHEMHDGGTDYCGNRSEGCPKEQVAWGNGYCRHCAPAMEAGVRPRHLDGHGYE